eukprot:scaffold23084_cov33-Tisochrysis_lutea.AAC.8
MHLLHEPRSYRRITRGEWIIEQVDLRVGVHGAREGYASSLSPGERHTLVTDRRQLAVAELLQVRQKLAGFHHSRKAFSVIGGAEENIVSHLQGEGMSVSLKAQGGQRAPSA